MTVAVDEMASLRACSTTSLGAMGTFASFIIICLGRSPLVLGGELEGFVSDLVWAIIENFLCSLLGVNKMLWNIK